MNMKLLSIYAGLSLAAISGLHAQATAGDTLPDQIGFTQAQPSFPLEDLSEFNYLDIEGQVAVVVYHASW